MANNQVNDLSVLQLVGIGAAIPKTQVDDAKKQLEMGEYNVSALVRINATIKKGADVTKPTPASLPHKLMIVALLSNMGEAQRKAFIRNMGEGKIKVHGYTEKQLDEDWKEIAALTTKVTSGPTTVKATVEIVEEA